MKDKQRLISQAIKLTVLGYKVEHKRSVVKKMAEVSIEPTMDLFRAIDEFNLAKMEFEALEQEHLALRRKVSVEQSDAG